MVGLVSKFKEWIKTEVKVDYEKLAIDVRGLAEHIEAEILDTENRIKGDMRTLRDAYDIKFAGIERKLDEAIAKRQPVAFPHPASVVSEEIKADPADVAGA